MLAKNANSQKNFKIKLLSGSQVVLVEADGYESEIFAPSIVAGRIAFSNVIPSRRCTTAIQKKDVDPPNAIDLEKRKPLTNILNKTRSVAGQESGHKLKPHNPMACSTPKPFTKENSILDGTLKTSKKQESVMSLPSPQAIRKAVVPSPSQVMRDALNILPPGVKVLRFYQENRKTKTPIEGSVVEASEIARRKSTSCMSNRLDNNSANDRALRDDSGFCLPNTPDVTCCSPIQILPNGLYGKAPKEVAVLSTEAKWRKCLTPKRTYARKNADVVKRSPNVGYLRKHCAIKVQPNFMENMTQGIKGDFKTLLRKRKLVVDPKTKISPKSFKKQLISKEEHESLSTIQIEPTSAFDLLTNSNRCHNITSKLNKQFRKGCVSKASSTHPKFKLLAQVVPPLDTKKVTDLKKTSLRQRDRELMALEIVKS